MSLITILGVIILSVIILGVIMLSVIKPYVILLSAIMVSVIMLSAIMLCVIMVSVVAPQSEFRFFPTNLVLGGRREIIGKVTAGFSKCP